jgi:hypothetical protein
VGDGGEIQASIDKLLARGLVDDGYGQLRERSSERNHVIERSRSF